MLKHVIQILFWNNSFRKEHSFETDGSRDTPVWLNAVVFNVLVHLHPNTSKRILQWSIHSVGRMRRNLVRKVLNLLVTVLPLPAFPGNWYKNYNMGSDIHLPWTKCGIIVVFWSRGDQSPTQNCKTCKELCPFASDILEKSTHPTMFAFWRFILPGRN